MEAIVKKNEFIPHIQRAQNIVEKKTTMPILGNVLLEAQKETLRICATDLEVGIIEKCPSEVHREGLCTVGARKLFEIVRELPEKEIRFIALDNILEISCQSSIFRLKLLPSEDFPKLPKFESSKFLNIPSITLKEMIRNTIFSVSTDETRYNLSGFLTQMDEREGQYLMRMVSTDGHRLSLCERKLSENEFLEELTKKNKESLDRSDVILPRKGVLEIGKIVEDGEGEVQLGIDKGNVMIMKNDITLIMRLIDGNFPEYRSVIPRKSDRVFSIDAQLLAESLRRMSTLAAERSKGVLFNLKRGHLTLSSSNPEVGEAQETLDVEYEGEEAKIGFNARYLLDIVQLTAGEVALEFGGELQPCLIKNKNDPDSLFIVMPMRI